MATILFDLLKAFDRVAFPLGKLKLLPQLYPAARHVELDGGC